MNNKTLDYYNQNAAAFIAGTVSVDFKETQDKFIDALCGKKILDFLKELPIWCLLCNGRK